MLHFTCVLLCRFCIRCRIWRGQVSASDCCFSGPPATEWQQWTTRSVVVLSASVNELEKGKRVAYDASGPFIIHVGAAQRAERAVFQDRQQQVGSNIRPGQSTAQRAERAVFQDRQEQASSNVRLDQSPAQRATRAVFQDRQQQDSSKARSGQSSCCKQAKESQYV